MYINWTTNAVPTMIVCVRIQSNQHNKYYNTYKISLRQYTLYIHVHVHVPVTLAQVTMKVCIHMYAIQCQQ